MDDDPNRSAEQAPRAGADGDTPIDCTQPDQPAAEDGESASLWTSFLARWLGADSAASAGQAADAGTAPESADVTVIGQARTEASGPSSDAAEG